MGKTNVFVIYEKREVMFFLFVVVVFFFFFSNVAPNSIRMPNFPCLNDTFQRSNQIPPKVISGLDILFEAISLGNSHNGSENTCQRAFPLSLSLLFLSGNAFCYINFGVEKIYVDSRTWQKAFIHRHRVLCL